MKIYASIFDEIVSVENLFKAWYKFRAGKTKREDVQFFARNLEQNIFALRRDLISGKYAHGH
ncbi:hypothetical protein HOC37_07010 [bacterium]|jgi:hypothetical protein|nr:hypothetical protein [bacterium]MBT5988573.1 hypothetical protein [bacterium]